MLHRFILCHRAIQPLPLKIVPQLPMRYPRLEILEPFVDVVESGIDPDKIIGLKGVNFQRMQHEIELGQNDVVVVFQLDRQHPGVPRPPDRIQLDLRQIARIQRGMPLLAKPFVLPQNEQGVILPPMRLHELLQLRIPKNDEVVVSLKQSFEIVEVTFEGSFEIETLQAASFHIPQPSHIGHGLPRRTARDKQKQQHPPTYHMIQTKKSQFPTSPVILRYDIYWHRGMDHQMNSLPYSLIGRVPSI